MTTNLSAVNCCNISLLSIGARAQVSSINPSDGSTEADACATLFNFVYNQLARTAYWNCLRNQASLSLLAAAAGTPENPQGTTLPIPPTPWLYSYQLPSDCLQARYVLPPFPNPQTGTSISPAMVSVGPWVAGEFGQIPFKVAYGVDASNSPIPILLTKLSQAQLVYTVNQPNPAIWDVLFQSAFVASLAAYLVPALSLNMALMQMQIQIADRIIGEARVRDGNEGSSQQDHTPDWMTARSASSYGACGYGAGYAPYGNMFWPG